MSKFYVIKNRDNQYWTAANFGPSLVYASVCGQKVLHFEDGACEEGGDLSDMSFKVGDRVRDTKYNNGEGTIESTFETVWGDEAASVRFDSGLTAPIVTSVLAPVLPVPAFSIGDSVLIQNNSSNRWAGQVGIIADPAIWGHRPSPGLQAVKLPGASPPMWFSEVNLVKLTAAQAVAATSSSGMTQQPAPASPTTSQIFKVGDVVAFTGQPRWSGQIISFYRSVFGCDCANVRDDIDGSIYGVALGMLGLVFPGAQTQQPPQQQLGTACNPPSNGQQYANPYRDIFEVDVARVLAAAAKPEAAKNDCPCPGCGDPRYSRAELESKTPCWICGFRKP